MTRRQARRNAGGRRVVLVTGGSLGIGKEIARAFGAQGDLVILCARGREALRRAAAELTAAGAAVEVAVADVADDASVAALIDGVLARHGRLDVAVNNAGIYGPIGRFVDNDLADWWQALDVNLGGVVRICHRVLPGMIAAGRGAIVNLSGGGATAPKPGYSAYATAKAALVRLTEVLAHELAPHGIRVNAIAPGFVATRLHQDTLAAGEAAPDREAVVAQLAGGGEDPRSAAELAVFLASEAAAGVTGRLISARWDDWRSLADGSAALAGSDLYTLRRVDDVFIREVPRE